MCSRIGFVGALLSMFVAGDATAQTYGANWFEQLFGPPQHSPPSFARPGVSPPSPGEHGPSLDEKARPRAGAVSKQTTPISREADSEDVAPATQRKAAAKQGRNSALAKRYDRSPGARSGRLSTVRATWYQHRGRTASGEKFNPEGRTAAHKTLPLGTRLRVVNQQTGRSVTVRVNDRVPRTAKHPVDLSRGSARALGIADAGVASVALHEAR